MTSLTTKADIAGPIFRKRKMSLSLSHAHSISAVNLLLSLLRQLNRRGFDVIFDISVTTAKRKRRRKTKRNRRYIQDHDGGIYLHKEGPAPSPHPHGLHLHWSHPWKGRSRGDCCSLRYATTHSRRMKQPIVHQCQFSE